MSDDRDVYEKLGRPPRLPPAQEFLMRQYREAGMTIKQCESAFNVSRTTVYRVLAKQRKMFGPEKLPNGHLARSHLTRPEIPEQE
jgi:DNA invertase Pin-like site-specific DNA recombinase